MVLHSILRSQISQKKTRTENYTKDIQKVFKSTACNLFRPMYMKKHIRHILYLIPLFLLFSCNPEDQEYSSFVEVIDTKYRISTGGFLSVTENLSAVNHYQYKNHYLLEVKNRDLKNSFDRLSLKYPDLIVKTYDRPFYIFDRFSQYGLSKAKHGKNIIFTANLVNDPKLQDEYLQYHKDQLLKFPGVTKGFCNADFQNLLVFRNGRQLLLIINIPEDKTLEELNPKTEENNPQTIEWNRMMKKYQTGIDDAPMGQAWVEFSSIK